MPSDMLDQLQEGKLRGLENLIESHEKAASDGLGNEEAAAIADFFVDEGIGIRQSSRRLWDHYWTRALAGKIPDKKDRGRKLLALLERGGNMILRGAAIARTFAALSGHSIARLSQFEEQSKAYPLWVKECAARWDMLSRPRAPLDRERLAQSRAAYERGEGEFVADVVDRLRQGGPLVKE